jgi:hypothetical protein
MLSESNIVGKMFFTQVNQDNALVRTYNVSALGRFDGQEEGHVSIHGYC